MLLNKHYNNACFLLLVCYNKVINMGDYMDLKGIGRDYNRIKNMAYSTGVTIDEYNEIKYLLDLLKERKTDEPKVQNLINELKNLKDRLYETGLSKRFSPNTEKYIRTYSDVLPLAFSHSIPGGEIHMRGNNSFEIPFKFTQSDPDDNYKGHIKLINNNKGIQKDIDKNNTNKNKKAILKKETDTEIKNFLEDDDSPINDKKINRDKIIINSFNDKNYSSPESYIKGQQGKESKKGKKTRFYVKPKTEEKNNNSKFKRKKTRKKKV